MGPHSHGYSCCHRVQLVGELLLELLVRGLNFSGVGLFLGSTVRGWSPTGSRAASRTLGQGFKPLRCCIAPRIRSQGMGLHMSNQGTLDTANKACTLRVRKNHPTLTGQETRNCASLAQSVSLQQPPLTLPITGSRRHMMARQLKLREELIKPGLWRMQT